MWASEFENFSDSLSSCDFSQDEADEFDSETGSGGITEGIPKEVLVDPVLVLKWLDEHSPEKDENIDTVYSPIVKLIQEAGIDYIDHRDKGGCLWIFGGYELSDFVCKCKKSGYEFHFKEGGGKATKGFDAWWSKN